MKVRHSGPLLFSLFLLVACSGDVRTAPHGEAWPRLRERELRAFMDDRLLFRREFRTQPGSAYSQSRCSGCHNSPSIGGAGVDRVQKVSRFAAGRCDALTHQGGAAASNASGLIAAPPLYGLAAIEAIPEDEILKRVDAGDADGDGISGRAGRAANGRVGRFGRKATHASLRPFVDAELRTQMGVMARGAESDTIVSRLTQFVRLLAFPARDVPRAARDSIKQGERLFQRIGCAACHEPSLPAGRSPVRGLRGKSVPLYSDLLLHDLGPGLAGACAPGSEPGEWRTAPLFGLRLRPQLMHDGRVQTMESAVRLHGGEAESSRALFDTLSPEEQALLLRFLRSL